MKNLKQILVALLVINQIAAPIVWADSNQTSRLLGETGQVQVADPHTKARDSHIARGLIGLSLVGLQLGTGYGLRTQEPNPDISLRAVHMISSISLLGLALYNLDELSSLNQNKPENKTHRILGYTYLGLLAVTAVVGLIRVRAVNNRGSSADKTWGDIHTGLGAAAAGTLIGTAFTVHF